MDRQRKYQLEMENFMKVGRAKKRCDGTQASKREKRGEKKGLSIPYDGVH